MWSCDNPVRGPTSTKGQAERAGVAGDYVVAERNQDGSILLTPDTSIDAMRERLGLKSVGADEFEQTFGNLKIDDEG